MQAVTGVKVPLTVMTILPSREALFEQFLNRARSGEYEEWWDKRETFRRVKRKLRGRLLKLFRRPPKFLKRGPPHAAERLCLRRTAQHLGHTLGGFS